MDHNLCQIQPQTLAMAKVEYQQWQRVLDGGLGLRHGTIFEELILPFYGKSAACNQGNRMDRGCRR